MSHHRRRGLADRRPTLLVLMFVIACGGGGGGGGSLPTAPNPIPNVAGRWTGTIESPTAASCNRAFVAEISQSGSDIVGSFELPGNASGSFQATLSGNSASGVFTSNVRNCSGTGNLSGTATSSRIEVEVPSVTTAIAGCSFCQDNRIVLTR